VGGRPGHRPIPSTLPAFVRQVGVLAGGTALGQVLLLAASPALTRLYVPDDFGALAVFASIVGVLAVAAGLRYELAIPVAESAHDGAHVLVLALLAVLASTAVVAFGVAMLGHHVVAAAPSLGAYLWLIPVGVLAIGTVQSLNYWAIRSKAFGLIARTQLTQSAISVGTQVAVGASLAGPLGLLLGQILGRTAGVVALARHALSSLRTARVRITARDLRRVARRYANFPLYSTWTGLTNALGREAPPLLLVALFGATTTGHYALGARVLQAPMALVGNAVGQVFLSRASDAARAGRLGQLVIDVLEQLLRIGAPVLTVLAIVAPELFAVVFGPPWRTAGVYAQWFAPWLALVFVASPMSTLPSVLDRQKPELAFQVALLASRVAALAIGGALGDPLVAIALFSIVSAANWFVYLLWTIRIAGASVATGLRRMGRVLVWAALLAIPAAIGKAAGMGAVRDLPAVLGAAASFVLIGAYLAAAYRRRTTP
jgi:O-antigen/teichoic acid export membrane protein